LGFDSGWLRRKEVEVKLRIQGNSLRLRVSNSELARFAETGRLEETIYFGPERGSELTYILAREGDGPGFGVEASAGRVKVLVPVGVARGWAESDQVGIDGEVDLGARGRLSILIEKDFACIDRSEEENADTFPNPAAMAYGCKV
jgi:hypothetical protein